MRERYVVYLGRLSPEKGVDVLFKAMAGLPYTIPRILGDGPLAEQAMGRYGRQIVESNYSVTAHYEQLLGIYSEVEQPV